MPKHTSTVIKAAISSPVFSLKNLHKASIYFNFLLAKADKKTVPAPKTNELAGCAKTFFK